MGAGAPLTPRRGETAATRVGCAPGAGPEARRDGALVLAAGMAGAVALSRAVDDPVLSDRLLLAARRFYTDSLAGSASGAAAEYTTEDAEHAHGVQKPE